MTIVLEVPLPVLPSQALSDLADADAWITQYAETYAEHYAQAYARTVVEAYYRGYLDYLQQVPGAAQSVAAAASVFQNNNTNNSSAGMAGGGAGAGADAAADASSGAAGVATGSSSSSSASAQTVTTGDGDVAMSTGDAGMGMGIGASATASSSADSGLSSLTTAAPGADSAPTAAQQTNSNPLVAAHMRLSRAQMPPGHGYRQLAPGTLDTSLISPLAQPLMGLGAANAGIPVPPVTVALASAGSLGGAGGEPFFGTPGAFLMAQTPAGTAHDSAGQVAAVAEASSGSSKEEDEEEEEEEEEEDISLADAAASHGDVHMHAGMSAM